MADIQVLDKLLIQTAGDLPGFMGASLVDLDSGMSLATYSVRADLDLAVASAYNSEMVKQKLKTIEALSLDTELEDMLLTLGEQLHLIQLLNSKCFIYIAAERKNTNLAILRMKVNQYIPEFRKAIGGSSYLRSA
ncbi:MAG: hypothetical protein KTR25_18625 [Myxococcales bacterium]|nr:hypothetical protein [Myxococcales bacterium]